MPDRRLEKIIEIIVREEILAESKRLNEIRDYQDSRYARWDYDDYLVAPSRNGEGVVLTLPYSEGKGIATIASADNKFYPGASISSYSNSPEEIDKAEEMVSMGMAKKVDEDQTKDSWTKEITFKYQTPKAQPGSVASTTKKFKDVPDVISTYYIYGIDSGSSIRVNHNEKAIDLDLTKALRWNSRRPGGKPNSSGQSKTSYAMPSGNTSELTTQELKKTLKHVLSKDSRDISSYRIIGDEKYRDLTVADVLGSKKFDHDKFVNPSATDLIAYHGTSSKLVDGILKSGLRPGKSQYSYVDHVKGWSEGNIYLTINPNTAENYATRAAIWYGGKPTILKITVPDPAKIVADEDSWGWVKIVPPIKGVDKNGKDYEIKEFHLRHWFGANSSNRLFTVDLSDKDKARIDQLANRKLLDAVKSGLKGSDGTMAYRGSILPNYIEVWREYPLKSYGTEDPDDEKYDKVRADTQAAMKRFDELPPKKSKK